MPLSAHSDWYSTKASRCASSIGCVMPRVRKSAAMAGPMLGRSSSRWQSLAEAALGAFKAGGLRRAAGVVD